jgi:hypothetical protein
MTLIKVSTSDLLQQKKKKKKKSLLLMFGPVVAEEF